MTKKYAWLGLGVLAGTVLAAGTVYLLPEDQAAGDAEATGIQAASQSSEAEAEQPAPAGEQVFLDEPLPEPEPESEPEQEPGEAPPAVSANAKAHLCYLSFNNPYESSVARRFATSLRDYPDAPTITVTEYQAKDADPEEALERLVRSGTRCDGLVLSGHHDEDGEFWGDRTSGDLEIDFLYELAARPTLSAWFSQVKALWLQGCHTATTRVFNPEVDAEYRVRGSPLAMINRHLDMAEIEDSLDDLYDIFLENTEEDNIILDYSRVFPSATIFTWWDQSPGIEAGSHWSLPFHIAQTSFVIDSSERFFQNPLRKPVPRDAALRYAEILYESMTRPTYPGRHAGPLQADEDVFIKGWKEHGRWAVHKRKYSFENASAVGHRSLLSSDSGLLKQIRGLAILLTQLDEEWIANSPTAVVNTILGHEEYIPYNVYLLWAFAQRSGGLKAKMVDSEALHRHLAQTCQLPGDGRLKKDYCDFSRFLYGEQELTAASVHSE